MSGYFMRRAALFGLEATRAERADAKLPALLARLRELRAPPRARSASARRRVHVRRPTCAPQWADLVAGEGEAARADRERLADAARAPGDVELVVVALRRSLPATMARSNGRGAHPMRLGVGGTRGGVERQRARDREGRCFCRRGRSISRWLSSRSPRLAGSRVPASDDATPPRATRCGSSRRRSRCAGATRRTRRGSVARARSRRGPTRAPTSC